MKAVLYRPLCTPGVSGMAHKHARRDVNIIVNCGCDGGGGGGGPKPLEFALHVRMERSCFTVCVGHGPVVYFIRFGMRKIGLRNRTT